jgi:hypothetical protein
LGVAEKDALKIVKLMEANAKDTIKHFAGEFSFAMAPGNAADKLFSRLFTVKDSTIDGGGLGLFVKDGVTVPAGTLLPYLGDVTQGNEDGYMLAVPGTEVRAVPLYLHCGVEACHMLSSSRVGRRLVARSRATRSRRRSILSTPSQWCCEDCSAPPAFGLGLSIPPPTTHHSRSSIFSRRRCVCIACVSACLSAELALFATAQEVKTLRVKVDTRVKFGTRRPVKLRRPTLQAHGAWAGWPQLRLLRTMQAGEELFFDYSRCAPLTHVDHVARIAS